MNIPMPPGDTGRVTYADGITEVQPGDRVSIRLFFRRRSGEVFYVPGISKRLATYDHNGLTWVGITLPDGWAVGEIVLPDTRRLKPTVRLLGRGVESGASADALRQINAQEAAEESERSAVSGEATGDDAKPTTTEWAAGLLAIALKLGFYLAVFVLIAVAIRYLRRIF